MRDGTLTGKFSYVIFEKGDRPKINEEFAPRILAVNIYFIFFIIKN